MPNIVEFRHLRYFIAVAEELNITRAAERLHTSQPSLGRQIRQLEELVGASLLHRRKHHVILTQAGETLLAGSRAMLRELHALLNSVQQAGHSEAGTIVVGFSPGAAWAVLSRLLPLLNSQYPQIRLVLHSLFSAEQIPALQNRSISVGFLRGPVSDPQISAEVIRSDRIVALIQAQHPLARLKRIPLERLVELPLIVSRGFHDALVSLAARTGVNFRTGLETDSILPAFSAVGSGLGFSLLPDYYEQILPKNVISRPLTLTPSPTIDLLVAYRKDDCLASLPLFLSLVRACFRTAGVKP